MRWKTCSAASTARPFAGAAWSLYEFGDDVRDIDWNVTARLGEPYRKKFVEERELTLLLLFEDSPSLNFGSGSKTKREALLELAGLLMLLGAVNRDRVGFIHSALDAGGTPRLHFRTPVRGRGAILHSAAQLLALPAPPPLSALPPPTAPSGRATEAADTLGALGTALRQINRSRAVPKHSVLVWLGDFAPRAQPEGWPVIQRRFQTMGFRVDDPWERSFPAELGGRGDRGGLLGGLPSGAALAAYDPLAGRLVTLEDSPAARAAHATWQREREEAWAALFPAAHNRLAVSTEDDQLDALVRFFHARMRLPH